MEKLQPTTQQAQNSGTSPASSDSSNTYAYLEYYKSSIVPHALLMPNKFITLVLVQTTSLSSCQSSIRHKVSQGRVRFATRTSLATMVEPSTSRTHHL
ncbi:hypothetical protein FGO68_gene8335 [Halteria grandinella]|uniref:Uncharacterized protein n=1 Tax=Halteria grandinella TaxID=5974 RepID=A0A8J8NJR3_HALGN|nr:hypothetical protein FGO68_gene8335 [Halteria grandinella]